MEIINKILKYNREIKEQKSINLLIKQLYKRLFFLSNLDEKEFIKQINYFLKEYDNFRFLQDTNILFVRDIQGHYRKMTLKEKYNLLGIKK